MVNILQLCAVDFTAYHLLRPLGAALRDAGFGVTFCCSPGEGLDLLRSEGFAVAPIPISRSYDLRDHVASFVRLYRLLRRERFTIVHAHTPVAGLIGRIAARFAGVPLVVYTAHGFYFHEGMRRPVRRFFTALERLGGRISDVIFVQSEEDWREALSEHLAPADRLVHIGNGVDCGRFGRDLYSGQAEALRDGLGLHGGPVVGFIGRVVREKGAMEFVRAAPVVKRAFPQAQFVMVGAPLPSDRDVCWDAVERLRGELNLGGDLVLTGYRRDVPAILALFDVFAFPSYREGMPRSLLEAMATGLPVVATDIRGCREEVVDGLTGYLVPPRDHVVLARAIVRILSSPKLRSSMGEAGRRRVLEHFDERIVVRTQVERLTRLVESSRRGIPRPPTDLRSQK